MSLLSKVGSQALPTTNNPTFQITGAGFAPKAVIVWLNHYTVDAAPSNDAGSSSNSHMPMSFGISDGASACCWMDSDDFTSGNPGYDNTNLIHLRNGGGADLVTATIVSLDSDGFTINVTLLNSDAGGEILNYMVLGGTDLTNVFLKKFTGPTTAVPLPVTGVGFKPDSLLLLGGIASGASSFASIGFATASNQAACSTAFSGVINRYLRTNKVYVPTGGGGSRFGVIEEADLTSMDADGFTLNYTTEAAASTPMGALCLKGGQFKVGSFLEKLSTGLLPVGGVGFLPSSVLFASVNNASSTSVDGGRLTMMLGGTDGTNRSLVGTTDNTFGISYFDRTKVLRAYADDSTPTKQVAADISSFDPDGFTLNFTQADLSTAREVMFIAFGSVGSTAPRRPLLQPGLRHPATFNRRLYKPPPRNPPRTPVSNTLGMPIESPQGVRRFGASTYLPIHQAFNTSPFGGVAPGAGWWNCDQPLAQGTSLAIGIDSDPDAFDIDYMPEFTQWASDFGSGAFANSPAFLYIVNVSDPTKWLEFTVTTISAPGGFVELDGFVSQISGANPFAMLDQCMIWFSLQQATPFEALKRVTTAGGPALPEIFELRNQATGAGPLTGNIFVPISVGDLMVWFIGYDTALGSVTDAFVQEGANTLSLALLDSCTVGALAFEVWVGVAANAYTTAAVMEVDFVGGSGACSVMAHSVRGSSNVIERKGRATEAGASTIISVSTDAAADGGNVVLAGVTVHNGSFTDTPSVGTLLHEALGSAVETSSAYQGGQTNGIPGNVTATGIQSESWDTADSSDVKCALIVSIVPKPGLMPIESVQSTATAVSQTVVLPIEAAGGIAATKVEQLESAGAVAQTGVDPLESAKGIVQTDAAVLEAAGGIASTDAENIEAAGGIATTGVEPLESIQPVAPKTAAAPFEAAQGVSSTDAATLEATGGIAATLALVIEAVGGIAQAAGAIIEAVGSVAQTGGEVLESLRAGIASSVVDVLEATQGITASGVDPLEATGGVAATDAGPIEATGAVSTTAVEPIESAQAGATPVSQTLSFALEALGGIAQAGGDAIESILSGITTTALDAYEALQSVASGGGATTPSVATLTALADAVDRTAYSTASISPTNGRAVLVAVINSKATAPDAVNTLTGCGQTWANEGTRTSALMRMTLFSAQISGASSGALTADFGGVTQTGCIILVFEFTGADGVDAFLQPTSNTGTGTSLSVTLASFASPSNATFGVFCHRAQEADTPGSGYAIISGSDVNHTPPAAAAAGEFQTANDTTVDMSWTTSAQAIGFAVEIVAGAGGGTPWPLEAAGGIAATVADRIEATGAVAATPVDPLESVQPVSQTTSLVPEEATQGLSSTDADALEAAQGITTTGADPIEAAGAVVQTGAEPIESLSPGLTAVSQTVAVPIEATGAVTQTATDPEESLQGGIASTDTPALEATGGIASALSYAFSAAQSVASSIVDVIESLLGLATSVTDPLEALKGVVGGLRLVQRFDGATFATTADAASNKVATNNAFTVSFWWKVGSYQNNILPRFWEKGSNYMAVMGDPTNSKFRKVAIEVQNVSGTGNANGGASEFWGSTQLVAGQWYHIAGVFDGSLGGTAQGVVYINGVAETMTNIFPWSGVLKDAATAFLLARRTGDLLRGGMGHMRHFVMYQSALTPTQVVQVLAADRPVDLPGTPSLVYWMDEGAGTSLNDAAGGAAATTNAVWETDGAEMPFDATMGVSTTELGPIESAQGISAVIAEVLEALRGVASTVADPIESAQPGVTAISQSLSFPIEATGAVTSTPTDPLESVQPVSQQTQAWIESLQSVAQLVVDPIESARGITATFALPIEAAGSVAAANALILEALSAIASTTTDPTEAVQGGITQSTVDPIESAKGLQSTVADAIESSGGVAGVGVDWIDAAGAVVGPLPLPFDSISQVASAQFLTLIESGRGVVAIGAPQQLEALGGIAGLGPLNLDAIGAIQQALSLSIEVFAAVYFPQTLAEPFFVVLVNSGTKAELISGRGGTIAIVYRPTKAE